MRTVLITGANRGLGLSIAKQLVKHSGYNLILCSRTKEGLKSFSDENLLSDHAEGLELDVTNENHIEEAYKMIKKKYGTLDVIVNNAGAMKRDPFSYELVKYTFAVNIYGVMNLVNKLYDLLPDDGQVVNMSSGLGQVEQMNKEKKEGLLNRQFKDEKEFLDLIHAFETDVKNEKIEDSGWMMNAYGNSKFFLNLWTIFRAQTEKRDVQYTAVSPGWCKTRMGGPNALRTSEEGIQTIIDIIINPKKYTSGKFYRDCEEIPY